MKMKVFVLISHEIRNVKSVFEFFIFIFSFVNKKCFKFFAD